LDDDKKKAVSCVFISDGYAQQQGLRALTTSACAQRSKKCQIDQNTNGTSVLTTRLTYG
jgi:hypothetical protein